MAFSPRRFAAPFLASILLIGCLFAMTASAISPATTNLVMSKKFPAFHGTINSPQKPCTVDRPVLLFLDRSGRPDKRLGGDRSNNKGYWKVDVSATLGSGAYYAKAPFFGSSEAGFTCKADRSRTVSVD